MSECPWDQFLWKGGDKSRRGRGERSSWDGGLAMTSANPVRNLGVKKALQNCPELGKMTRLLSSPHWTWTASGKRCDLGKVAPWRWSKGLSPRHYSWDSAQSLPGRGWSVSCMSLRVRVRVNQIVVQMHSLLWVLVKAVCKPFGKSGLCFHPSYFPPSCLLI